jgi:Flp pilus assembly pilin Flp
MPQTREGGTRLANMLVTFRWSSIAMKTIRKLILDFAADEQGATMVDYAVLLTILTLTLIATVTQMSQALITFFNSTASAFGSF